MKKYYVGHIYYFPLCYSISLINKGLSKDEAANMAIQKFARFGGSNSKRLKDFNVHHFNKHLNAFLNIPGAVLERKSSH